MPGASDEGRLETELPWREQENRVAERLRGLPRGVLIDAVMGWRLDSEAVRSRVDDLLAIRSGSTAQMAERARREMRVALTPMEWGGGGHDPDHGQLLVLLRALVGAGAHDVVLGLLPAFWPLAVEQEESCPESEAHEGLEECVEVFREALLASNLPDAEKLTCATDLLLKDGYGFAGPMQAVLDEQWPAEAWSGLVDHLREQLDALGPPPTDRGNTDAWHRRDLTHHLSRALAAAGRGSETTELLLTEAVRAGGYAAAVDRLLQDGRTGDAWDWTLRGLRDTPSGDDGTRAGLEDRLARQAASRGDGIPAVAVAASRFFRRADIGTHQALREAAAATPHAAAVLVAAQRFLESGVFPLTSEAWPLPSVEGIPGPAEIAASPNPHARFPRFAALIGVAIGEGRFDDGIDWYRRAVAARASGAGSFYNTEQLDEQVAGAVAGHDPAYAAALYAALADAAAGEAKTSRYPLAASRLVQARKLLLSRGLTDRWAEIEERFRAGHGRKPRMMEELAGALRRRR